MGGRVPNIIETMVATHAKCSEVIVNDSYREVVKALFVSKRALLILNEGDRDCWTVAGAAQMLEIAQEMGV